MVIDKNLGPVDYKKIDLRIVKLMFILTRFRLQTIPQAFFLITRHEEVLGRHRGVCKLRQPQPDQHVRPLWPRSILQRALPARQLARSQAGLPGPRAKDPRGCASCRVPTGPSGSGGRGMRDLFGASEPGDGLGTGVRARVSPGVCGGAAVVWGEAVLPHVPHGTTAGARETV